jgi:hypothetical protein
MDAPAHAATSPQARASYPLWLWPNLLSLDAPLVAVTWCALLARSLGLDAAPATLLLLGAAVWIIYAADRLLDVRRTPPGTARHQFAAAHRATMLPVLAAAIVIAGLLCLSVLPAATLQRGLAAAAFVAAYFYWVHRPQRIRVQPSVKRIAVALLFAAGVVLPLHPASGLGPAWAATAAVVWLNTLAIDNWESASRHSLAVTLAALAICALCLPPAVTNGYYAALSAGALLLLGLNLLRRRLSRNLLRASADAALLAPALALLWR